MYSLRNTSLYTQDAPPPLPQLLRIQVPVGTMGSLSAPWPKCHAPTARFTEQLGCILYRGLKVKVNEADLYTAFIEIPYTQGAQVRITQCYLQTTPYLPLPRKHSPDGASQTEVADI